MRIFKLINRRGFEQNHIIVHFTRMVYLPFSVRHDLAGRMMIFFSHQFSPKGQAGDFHYLRYDAYGVYVIKRSQ